MVVVGGGKALSIKLRAAAAFLFIIMVAASLLVVVLEDGVRCWLVAIIVPVMKLHKVLAD